MIDGKMSLHFEQIYTPPILPLVTCSPVWRPRRHRTVPHRAWCIDDTVDAPCKSDNQPACGHSVSSILLRVPAKSASCVACRVVTLVCTAAMWTSLLMIHGHQVLHGRIVLSERKYIESAFSLTFQSFHLHLSSSHTLPLPLIVNSRKHEINRYAGFPLCSTATVF